MTAELLKLAERCEKLTGPGREVDASVWLAVTPGATREPRTVRSATNAWPDYVIDETRDATGRLVIVPSYTTSLDAAVSLVPEHFAVSSLSWWEGHPATAVILGTHLHKGEYWHKGSDGKWSAEAATPALALTAAALRALAFRDDGHQEKQQ